MARRVLSGVKDSSLGSCMEFDRLLLWIESQPAIVIALITFGVCYLCAGIVFVIARVLVSKRMADELKATTPVMLTPLSVLTGLVIAFVASRIWINFDHANAVVRDEVRNIEEVVTLAEILPQNVQTGIRHGIGQYLPFTKEYEWPSMPGLSDAMSTLLSFVPENPGQQIAQQRTLAAIEQAIDARRSRILLIGAF